MTGLKPGCFYNVRAIATNAAGLSTHGQFIRIRTVPLSDHRDEKDIISVEGSHNAPVPRTGSIADDIPSSATLTVSRGPGSLHPSGKRRASVRRNPPPLTNGSDQTVPQLSQTELDYGETISSLTRELDSLRRQQDETSRQTFNEEDEAEQSKASLGKERDRLRQVLREKDETAAEFRKQVHELEKASKATQRKKSAKERILLQKKAERQKMKDETQRWNQEIMVMRKEATSMDEDKASVNHTREMKIKVIRQTIEDTNIGNKAMEEEIRLKGIQIKSLENERKRSDSGQDEDEKDLDRMEKEREQMHDARMQEFQTRYTSLWLALQQAEAENLQARERLAYWSARRAREPSRFAPIPGMDATSIPHRNRSRKAHQGGVRLSTVSHPSGGYPAICSNYNSVSSLTPTFASSSPFFNMSNGMSVSAPLEQLGMPQREVDSLAVSAPMSPSANTLLPANLLRDDDFLGRQPLNEGELESESSTIPDCFPNQRTSGPEINTRVPHSPHSNSSRSPSVFSSPHESLSNLQHYQSSSEMFTDSDRRSIQSTGSPFGPGTVADVAAEGTPIAARRLAGFFNFNRQRGKSSANELPPLGTLRQGQSQSFPRNFDQDLLEPIGSRSRRLSSATWTNPVASLLARSVQDDGTIDGSRLARTGAGRRNRLFGSKLEAMNASSSLEQPSSPRPSSTYSYENTLPRPSSDSQPFGWSMADTLRHRNSPLGSQWSLRSPWAQSQSHRQSPQHGSSSNLSLGSTPLDPEEFNPLHSKQSSQPAPIGTERFQTTQRPVTPKLNPAAPSFKTLFFSRSDSKKVDKTVEKGLEKGKARDMQKAKDKGADMVHGEASPPNPRNSRDARSITTATSMAESHDSLDYSTSGTASEGLAASAPKESLMQRITRKSSSSKFNISWAKDRTSLFTKKGEPTTPGELDEEDDSSEGHPGRSADSVTGTPQHEKGGRGSISWPHIMRKAKKGDKGSAEANDRQSEDETGDFEL